MLNNVKIFNKKIIYSKNQTNPKFRAFIAINNFARNIFRDEYKGT